MLNQGYRKPTASAVGGSHEFTVLKDDTWKKDDIFTLFSVRYIRMIAVEVGVPLIVWWLNLKMFWEVNCCNSSHE